MSFVKEDTEKTQVINEYNDSNSYISTFVEMTNDGFIILDCEGRIIICNDKAEELLDVQKDNIINQHITKYLSSIKALNALKAGVGYSEAEEIWRCGNDCC